MLPTVLERVFRIRLGIRLGFGMVRKRYALVTTNLNFNRLVDGIRDPIRRTNDTKSPLYLSVMLATLLATMKLTVTRNLHGFTTTKKSLTLV